MLGNFLFCRNRNSEVFGGPAATALWHSKQCVHSTCSQHKLYKHKLTTLTLIPWLFLGLERAVVPSPSAAKKLRFHQQLLISKTHDSRLNNMFSAFWKLYPILYLCQPTVSLKYCFQTLHIFSRGKSDVCNFAAISNS